MTGWSDASSISLSQNNTVVGARTYMYNSNISNPLMGLNIFKVDLTTKQILWDKTFRVYNSIECITLHQAMGVETLPNGDIIVSGTAEKTGYDAVILKLNSNGDSLWCKSYDYHPDIWDCQVNDLIVTDDGGFLGVGFFDDQGFGSTAWLFKTDANGVVGFESIKAKVKSKKYKVYPNPALDYTTLRYNCKYANLTYEISDMQGRVLITGKLETIKDMEANEVLIDLKGLSPGTYHFVIKTNDLRAWNDKLIIAK